MNLLHRPCSQMEGISREVTMARLWLMEGYPKLMRECGRTGKTWVLVKLNCLSIYEGTWQVISTLDNPFLRFMTHVNGNPKQSLEKRDKFPSLAFLGFM